jgi:hypothetical protein
MGEQPCWSQASVGVRPLLESGQKRSQIKWGASSNGGTRTNEDPGQTGRQTFCKFFYSVNACADYRMY